MHSVSVSSLKAAPVFYPCNVIGLFLLYTSYVRYQGGLLLKILKGKISTIAWLVLIQNIHPVCYELWPKTGECVDFQDKQGIHPYPQPLPTKYIDKASIYTTKGDEKLRKEMKVAYMALLAGGNVSWRLGHTL